MAQSTRQSSAYTGDTVENIRIEDPLDFLSASEKEAYLRERHKEEAERMRRVAEEEHAASSAARALSDRERARLKEETDDPLRERQRRRPRPVREAAFDAYEDDDLEDLSQEDGVDDVDDDDDYYDEDEDEGLRGILIGSGILGILIVVVLLFILWLRFFMPAPEEPEAEERAIQQAQEAEEQALEEEAQEEEELADELDLLLVEGFVRCDDRVRVTAQSGLKMRTEPDSSRDNAVTTIKQGTVLTRVAEDSSIGWSAVLVPDYEGVLYCSSKYLEIE